MNRVNNITICKDQYKTQEDFENAIKKAVMVLLDNEYIMTVRYDEPGLGIVCIDFDNSDMCVGTPYPFWLTPEQSDSVAFDDKQSSTSDLDYNFEVGM